MGVLAGAEVELALLVIDEKDRPQQLLASSSLIGTNQVLPFHLRFNPESFPSGARVGTARPRHPVRPIDSASCRRMVIS